MTNVTGYLQTVEKITSPAGGQTEAGVGRDRVSSQVVKKRQVLPLTVSNVTGYPVKLLKKRQVLPMSVSNVTGYPGNLIKKDKSCRRRNLRT